MVADLLIIVLVLVPASFLLWWLKEDGPQKIRYAAWYGSSWIMHRCINPLFVRGNPTAWKAPMPTLDEVFPRHRLFEKHWKEIRDEVLHLMRTPHLRPVEATSPAFFKWMSEYINKSSQDSGHVVAPNGQWKSALLRCYGQDFPRIMAICPTLTKIMNQLPEVKLVLVSVLEPHSIIPLHRGPIRSVIRYHLPVLVPGFSLDGVRQPDQDPDKCKITVGEDWSRHVGADAGGCLPGTPDQQRWPTVTHSWVPGQGLVFDDSYSHSVVNRTDERRAVLFIDILRPVPPGWNWSFGDWISRFLDLLHFHKMVFLLNGLQETVQKA